MKKAFFISIAILSAYLSLVSCNKSSSGSGDIPVYTDPLLVATWNVVKYEALDKNGDVLETEETGSIIAATYYKFVFDGSGLMQCWFSVSAGQCITTMYSYFSEYGSLLFGDTGVGYVSTLNDTSLVFESEAFAPVEWYEKPGISTFRVTCTKQVE